MYGGAGCDFQEDSERYPANEDKDYFGRGPLLLEGNEEFMINSKSRYKGFHPMIIYLGM